MMHTSRTDSVLASDSGLANRDLSLLLRRGVTITALAVLMLSGAGASAAPRTVALQWDPVQDARVHHYELHYGTSAGRYDTVVVAKTSAASVDLPQDGKSYYFAARACDELATNCSAFSNELTVSGSSAEPEAAFSASALSGTVPLTVTFMDQTAGTVTSRSWDFGDGVTSQASTAVHTYIVPGTYSVALKVTGPSGTDTETRSGYIKVYERESERPSPEEIPSPGGEDPRPVITSLDAFEVRDITVDHQWKRINFDRRFKDPVVIAGGLGYRGTDPTVVRIRDIDSDGFWVRAQEWNYLDGWHAVEKASYIALERGNYLLPGGIRVEAGSLKTDATAVFQFQELTAGFEKPPIVLASINSMNGAQTVTHRLRDITKNGFFIAMWEEEMNDQFHMTERVDYIAWQASSGEVGDVRFEVGIANQSITNALATVSFGSQSASTPSFLAAMQTTNGTDPGALRVPSVTKTAATLFVEEERSKDAETYHAPEKIGYFVAERRR